MEEKENDNRKRLLGRDTSNYDISLSFIDAGELYTDPTNTLKLLKQEKEKEEESSY